MASLKKKKSLGVSAESIIYDFQRQREKNSPFNTRQIKKTLQSIKVELLLLRETYTFVLHTSYNCMRHYCLTDCSVDCCVDVDRGTETQNRKGCLRSDKLDANLSSAIVCRCYQGQRLIWISLLYKLYVGINQGQIIRALVHGGQT